MNSVFRRFIATFLLAGFSVFLIPKEFVHALYGHADTQEKVSENGKNSISSHHTHCAFLTYEASLYTLSSLTKIPVSADHSFAYSMVAAENSGIVFSDFSFLRGPPTTDFADHAD